MGRKLTTEEFIERARAVHGDEYDYSLANYTVKENKIEIICRKHGSFFQIANNHMRGAICKKCATENQRMSFEEYLSKIDDSIKEKYKFIKIKYRTLDKPLILTECKRHGRYWQRVDAPISGKVCRLCSNEDSRNTLDYFINKCKKIHNNKYDYSKVNYNTARDIVEIRCPIHDAFFQTAASHMQGRGCPTCKSSRGEKRVRKFLKKNDIKFDEQKRFDNARFSDTNSCMIFDFYLSDYNTIIEYDGRHHFEPIEIWGGQRGFENVIKKDNEKNDYCLINDIELLRIPHTEFDNIEKILKEKLNLK